MYNCACHVVVLSLQVEGLSLALDYCSDIDMLQRYSWDSLQVLCTPFKSQLYRLSLRLYLCTCRYRCPPVHAH